MPQFPSILVAALVVTAPCRAQSYATPEPYGGKQAVGWMLEQEQHFPAGALAAGINGEATIAFKVLADGSTEHLRVQIPLDPACDAEALRLVRLIRWMPASTGGTALDTDHSIAIPFNAKRYKKLHAKRAACPPLASNTPVDGSYVLYTGQQVDTLAAPRIPGGLRSLPHYLAGNLKYPPEAFRLDIQGKVTIEFVVEASGSVSNLRTLNFLGGGCDDEAMRLARTICWHPAIKEGKLVRSIMKLDIQFRLDPSSR
ncbi:MAG TPA: energy transducer TonB [Flavobacteriales bacterium]|nr:energy transducer TonB [Flavobacteriales bacterium]